MYDPNAQNSLIRLRNELNECCYDSSMKDYLSNMIIRIMNYPKKTTQARYFIKVMDLKKIMMVWYPMSVPFMNRNYNVPIQIYIMKNIPYEPPQIFLEVVQGSAASTLNKDIDQNNNRISTKSLRSWNQYSNIENILDEIFESFSKNFPLYKKKPNQQKPTTNQNNGGYYGMPKSKGSNPYQPSNNNINNNANNNNYYNQMGKYGYKPPTKSIYGRSMTLDGNKSNQQPSSFGGGIYGNNNNNNYNNNNQQPTSFGGGIYGNNNYNNRQEPSSFGGGIYSNNNNKNNNSNYNNNPQPNSFGGGIYENNNNNNYNQKPNSFGGGIYENNNNNNKKNENNNGNNQNGGFYDFTNKINQNQYNNNYNNNQPEYAAPPPIPLVKNVDEDLKNILLNEVCEKISNKLIEEKKRLNEQNKKMEEYKSKFYKENEKLKNFLNAQMQIKFKCEEDMTNMKNAIRKVKDYNDNNKIIIVDEENCLDYLDLPNKNAIKIIADEACMEEMILIVRKGFERKKISFDEALFFMRNSSRDLFSIKFLMERELNKYKY